MANSSERLKGHVESRSPPPPPLSPADRQAVQAGESAGSTLGFFRGYKSITRTAFFPVWQEGIE